MVRLKGGIYMPLTDTPTMFQFQYGSIKRPQHPLQTALGTRFQFQYGSIKSKQRERSTRLWRVSIPIWFD